jgi:hypothetical protein
MQVEDETSEVIDMEAGGEQKIVHDEDDLDDNPLFEKNKEAY